MKLALRDLFWLLLMTACLCAWWVERRKSHALDQTRAATAKELSDLQRKLNILEQQYNHLQMKLAQEGYGFHFDIYQYPDGKVDVRFIDGRE